MPGSLLRTHARARRASLPLLLVYFCVLTLLQFGHQCGLTGVGSGSAPPGDQGQHLTRASATDAATDHVCPACAFQRDAASTAFVHQRTFAPSLRWSPAAAPVVLALFGTALLTQTSRGPPLS